MRRLVVGGVAGLLALSTVACGSESAGTDTTSGTPTAGRSASATLRPVTFSSTPTASASPVLFATGCGEGLVDLSGPLTGTWRADDGGLYWLRQAGGCLWWFGTSFDDLDEAGGHPSWGWANVAVGRIVDDTIYLEWSDVLGEGPGRGTLTLRISGDGDHIEKVDESRPDFFGGSLWERVRPGPSASAP